ncbi:hypothetical protein EDC04DRAFT_2897889 [Pisolithus marmoratus]|nr:hypothetical protein EDC04DRAFT_2897889 [Pisolithus marmoratus]
MLAPETLLRILVRFPKLLITIAKRCSSTTLHFLRYIFSLWNVSAQKLRERKHLTKGNSDNSALSTLPSNVREKGKASILCSNVRPADRVEGSEGHALQVRCSNPPLRDPKFLRRLPNIFSMLSSLDHPGFISRALGATQRKQAVQKSGSDATQRGNQSCGHETDVEKWKVFGDTFQKDVENINLLATVLLTANFSFLAIQSIDGKGLSYWPQRLSYTSLLCALGSILMGLAVRTPRFFTAYSSFYFQVMALVLGFPFELFLYRCVEDILLVIAL